MKLFSKEKIGSRLLINILGVSFKFLKVDLKDIFEKNSDNNFLKDLVEKGFKFNKKKTLKLISKYENNLQEINDFLYTKLNDEDKKTFIQFCLKRLGLINVIEKEEEKYLNDLFEKAYKIYTSRTSVNEPMPVEFKSKKLNYLSNSSIKKMVFDKKTKLFCCYEMVHAFFINEYYKEGFSPKDGQIIFDCGSCSGDTALAFSVQYPNSKTYTFECEEKLFELTKKNIEINDLKNIYPQKGFLSSKTGGLEINGKTEQTISIDDFVKENDLKDIGLIKFDIEGAEQEALKGAINTIKEQKPILMIPIYHLENDIYEIPKFLHNLNMPIEFSLKWTEKRILGVDCVLFVKFI